MKPFAVSIYGEVSIVIDATSGILTCIGEDGRLFTVDLNRDEPTTVVVVKKPPNWGLNLAQLRREG